MPWPERISRAHLPTPLWHNQPLSRWLGLEPWVKRDDMSAGAAAGNKIRKLEFLLQEARLTHKPQRALFIRTGGLPGLLAQASEFRAILNSSPL